MTARTSSILATAIAGMFDVPEHLRERLSLDDSSCDWRTIDGAHVCLKEDGTIAKDPAHLIGKTTGDSGHKKVSLLELPVHLEHVIKDKAIAGAKSAIGYVADVWKGGGGADGAEKKIAAGGIQGKIGTGLKLVAAAGFKLAYAPWIAGETAVEAVAKAKGLTDAEAAKVRTLCTGYDILACKAVFLGLEHAGLPHLAAQSAFIPTASVAYLIHATATNPIAVAKAAYGAVKKVVGKALNVTDRLGLDGDLDAKVHAAVGELADAIKAHSGDDWFMAVLPVAIEETGHRGGTIGDAIKLAEEAMKETPMSSPNDLPLSADAQWSELSGTNGAGEPFTASVHRTTGAMGKLDANNFPPGSVATMTGLPSGPVTHTVESHADHAHDNFVVPKLKLLGGGTLTHPDVEPHMGHVADTMQYGEAMGHQMKLSVTPGTETQKSESPKLQEETKLCPKCGSANTSWVRSLSGNLRCQDCNTLSTVHRPSAHENMALPTDGLILDAGTIPDSNGTPIGEPTYEEIPTEEIIGQNSDGSPIFKMKKVPIQHYRKVLVKAGTWHRRNGAGRFQLSHDDLDDAVKNYNLRKAAGIKPWLPDCHMNSRLAAANNGEVDDVVREGDDLVGKLRVVGTKGAEAVLKNDVSVHLVNGNDELVIDAHGTPYKGYVLHHVALTPNPNQPHLGPFQRIAASADATDARDVPVFAYAGNLSLGANNMACTPAEMAMAKEHLAAHGEDASDVTPDNAMGKVMAHAKKMTDMHKMMKGKQDAAKAVLALSADADLEPAVKTVKTNLDSVTAERDQLKTALAAETSKVLSLSADDPSSLRPMDLSAFEMNADTMMEQAIKMGRVSSADAKSFKALLRTAEGKPTRLGLSASGPNGHAFEYNFWRTVCNMAEAIKTQNASSRGTIADPKLALDASAQREATDADKEKLQDDELAIARRTLGLTAPVGAK
jgi:hypothetical protein